MDPQRKAQNETVGSWLFSGLNLKTILFATVAVTAAYYAQQGRVGDRLSVNEEKVRRIEEVELASLQVLRDTTLRKDTYDRDQLREAEEFKDLRDRQRATDQILMQRGLGSKVKD